MCNRSSDISCDILCDILCDISCDILCDILCDISCDISVTIEMLLCVCQRDKTTNKEEKIMLINCLYVVGLVVSLLG